MKKFILWGLLCVWCFPSQAQQNYEKAYKKAHAFTSSSQDSALVWATKCVRLAQTKDEKHRAYYLHGFNAFKLCMYGTALYDYEQAREFAPDSVAYFRINNNLASTYLRAGQHAKATKLNQQSIRFNLVAKKWVNLSYAYNVKSNILCKVNDQRALVFIHKALQLRKKYAPKQVGYVYEEAARIFSTFQKYDSAVVYQRLALKHYPSQSSNVVASLHIQLAQYLIMANQAPKALAHLQKARGLQKNGMRQLFWCHTFGLYLSRMQQMPKARQIFSHCDSLLQSLLVQTSSIVNRQTISEYAQEMYHSILELKNLKITEQEFYENRLDSAKADLKRYRKSITLKDSLYLQLMPKSIARKEAMKKLPQAKPTAMYWYGLLALVGLLGLASAIRKRNSPQKPVTNEVVNSLNFAQLQKMQHSFAENELIRVIEEKTGTTLPADIKEMVRLYYHGTSIKTIAQKMHMSFDKVRYRFRSIAQKMGEDNFRNFIEHHKHELNKGANPKPSKE